MMFDHAWRKVQQLIGSRRKVQKFIGSSMRLCVQKLTATNGYFWPKTMFSTTRSIIFELFRKMSNCGTKIYRLKYGCVYIMSCKINKQLYYYKIL